MPSRDPVTLTAMIVLAIAVAWLAWISARRHRRFQRRSARLEQALNHQQALSRRLVGRVYPREIESAARAAGRAPLFNPEMVSQFGEDAFLWDLFDGKLDGFFIEVGAYDGYSLSATYALEAAGWTGLLVEALPERFEQCRKRRPGSRVVQAAVSKRGSTGTATFQSISGGNDATSDMVSGLSPQAEQRRLIERYKANARTITVPLTTLADLLKDHKGPIDVAIIDVEGSERDVLDGLELERTRPRVLVVEDLSGNNVALMSFLAGAGYVCQAMLGHNRIWVRADEPALVERANSLAGSAPWTTPLRRAGTP